MSSTPAVDAAGTSVERAYEALRTMAIDFNLRPGERVNEVELARRFQMSRVPIREAMNRLVSEGLLTVLPKQGFSCRRLSATEIVSLYEVRGDLEAAAAEKAARDASVESLTGLEAFARGMLDAVGAPSVAAMVARDEEFHMQMAMLAGNAERAAMLRNINARIRFVRRINLEVPARMRKSLEEHVAIAQALGRRDGQLAAKLVRRHLNLSADEAVEAVSRGLALLYADRIA